MGGIVWLASYPKSGNTWMRAFLHNLLRNPDRPVPLDELDRFCFGESHVGWYERLAGRPAAELSVQEVAALRPQVHAHFTRLSPDTVFVKTHNRLAESHGHPLVDMAVTAGGIYILRNPLDLCLSLADHFGTDVDGAIAMMANPQGGSPTVGPNVYEVYGSWSQHVAGWTHERNKGLIWVRYEDMLAKPRKSFGRIAGYLGLRPPPARLDKAIRYASFGALRRLEETGGFRERSAHSQRFFRVGQAGQWRKALSEAQIARIVEAHEAEMRRFGYLPGRAAERQAARR